MKHNNNDNNNNGRIKLQLSLNQCHAMPCHAIQYKSIAYTQPNNKKKDDSHGENTKWQHTATIVAPASSPAHYEKQHPIIIPTSTRSDAPCGVFFGAILGRLVSCGFYLPIMAKRLLGVRLEGLDGNTKTSSRRMLGAPKNFQKMAQTPRIHDKNSIERTCLQ